MKLNPTFINWKVNMKKKQNPIAFIQNPETIRLFDEILNRTHMNEL